MEKVRSKELVQCYKDLMIKFPEECVKYNIAGSIASAEAILTWEDENGKKVENLVDEGFMHFAPLGGRRCVSQRPLCGGNGRLF